MLKKSVRLALVALVAAPMVLTTQGCTNGEVLGSIAIVTGVIAIGASQERHHDHYSPPPPPPPRHRGPGHGRGHGPGRRYDASLQIDGLSQNDAAQTLVSKYGIPMKSAERLAEALEIGKKGDASALLALGLQADDFERLAEMRMITDSGLTALAASLEMSKDATETLVANIIDDFRKQASDSSSDYWQACMNSGSWKTPENRSCQESFWSGCSPETGASLCLPAH
jgi:hypothetical protein